MDTMLLDTATWDLVLDANGNWAVASVPYALAQDVASAIKAFLGEVWYNSTLGVPWFQKILGMTPPLSWFQQLMVQTALNVVPTTSDVYVTSAVCTIQSFNAQTRTVTGQVQFTDSSGTTSTVSF